MLYSNQSIPCLAASALQGLADGALDPLETDLAWTHLRECRSCRSLLRTVHTSTEVYTIEGQQPFAGSGSASSEPLLPAGTRVHRFRIIRALARGGMGEVYLAHDAHLSRQVALKLVRPERIGSTDGIRRFLTEARTTACFNHPHIVTIYDVGQHDGRPFIALEYIKGETLRQRLSHGPLTVDQSLEVSLAVADALNEAHGHGVLHLDLKPENVMVSADGGVRVLDFGLAAPSSSETILPDQPHGTPAYMAPEQWLTRTCSTATDVWAFGAMLFELLCGKQPYQETSLRALRASVLNVPPSTVLGRLQPGLPPTLLSLVLACLSKRCDQRPSTAAIRAQIRALIRKRKVNSRRRSRFRHALVASLLLAAIGFHDGSPIDVEPVTSSGLVGQTTSTESQRRALHAAQGVAGLRPSGGIYVGELLSHNTGGCHFGTPSQTFTVVDVVDLVITPHGANSFDRTAFNRENTQHWSWAVRCERSDERPENYVCNRSVQTIDFKSKFGLKAVMTIGRGFDEVAWSSHTEFLHLSGGQQMSCAGPDCVEAAKVMGISGLPCRGGASLKRYKRRVSHLRTPDQCDVGELALRQPPSALATGL